jgi:signal transduction histidine kinase
LEILASRSDNLSRENSLLLKELQQQTKNIIQSLRHLSQDLRPATLDRLGLLPALGYLASEVTRLSGIETKVTIQGKERRLGEEVELMLFRITQEALNNIWKHSEARRAEIMLEFHGSDIRVNIETMVRFYLADTMNNLSKDGKLGLAGMKESSADKRTLADPIEPAKARQ